MTNLKERIRNNQPVPAPVAALLTACTPLTRLGMWWRKRADEVRVDARVISYGNLTAGGTGKTPAVIERVQQELAAGHRVAVLTRGYGAPATAPYLSKPDTPVDASFFQRVGDEPALIAKCAPGVIIAKGADRVTMARRAIKERGCDTLILDDGFQQVRLARDENVLVIDASNPFGNGHLIPRGVLREPVAAMARATHILLTHCDAATNLPALLETIAHYAPQRPIRKTRHAARTLWRVNDGQEMPLSELNGLRIHAVSAIAHPERFVATLKSLGAEIISAQTFSDHHAFGVDAMPSNDLVVVTEKDAVRLANAPDHVYALGIALEDIV